MRHDLSTADLQRALALLGKLCREETRIILAGSVSLMLQGIMHRVTNDGDVLESHPDFGQLREILRQVAAAEGIPDHWRNDSARTYAEVLPPDYQSRLRYIGPFGRLSVGLVSRQDMIVMKFFAGRPKDIGDLQAIAPTDEELAFVRRQLPRLRHIDSARVEQMDVWLNAWPVAAPTVPGRPPPAGNR